MANDRVDTLGAVRVVGWGRVLPVYAGAWGALGNACAVYVEATGQNCPNEPGRVFVFNDGPVVVCDRCYGNVLNGAYGPAMRQAARAAVRIETVENMDKLNRLIGPDGQLNTVMAAEYLRTRAMFSGVVYRVYMMADRQHRDNEATALALAVALEIERQQLERSLAELLARCGATVAALGADPRG